MKVLAHLDPVVLERALLDELAASTSELRPHAGLVIVPTSRLADHLQRRLIERRPAWLGIEVRHFQALGRDILGEAGLAAPRLLSPRLTEALVRKVLGRYPGNRWSRYVGDRPGALSRLAGSLKDLREASVASGEVKKQAGSDGSSELAVLFEAFVEELDRVRDSGWVDEAGLATLATTHARAFAERRGGIWLHGAYELIGAHLRLLRALDAGREVRVLLPYEAGTAVSRYAGRLLRGHDGDIAELPSVEGRLPLAALYDEQARPTPCDTPGIAYRSAQGAAAEVKGAVRAALRAVRGGCPPAEIVIAARSLAPYEAALDEVLEREGLPWTGSLALPLRNHPAIHDLSLLIKVLDEDFPRRGTAELLRSPRIHWDRIAEPGVAPRGERADRWSREAGIVRGLDEWRELLVESVGQAWGRAELSPDEQELAERRAAERVDEAKRIGETLARLQDRVEPANARRWSAWAATLGELLEIAFDTNDDDAVWDDVAALLEEMKSLETVVGETGPVRFADMRRWFDAAVDRSDRQPQRRDNGGIRVLDMMQMRGLTCRQLFLVGMNSGVLPRPPRPDPVLDDELRKALDGPDNPLPIKREGLDEEKLLLGLTLGAATESIELAWQRADEAGRGRAPSLALRETSRLSHGVPDLAARIDDAAWHPSHPTHALEWMLRTRGLLSAREERLFTALRCVGQPGELSDWYPELNSGLTMLRATESFAFGESGFDGRIGRTTLAERPMSVSALERLAGCPLRFFFDRVLRVREFEEEADPFALTARETGQCAHDVLERLYAAMNAGDAFGLPLEERQRRANEILDEVWDDAWRSLARRLTKRAPALWAVHEARWKGAISRFVEDDLERLELLGWGAPETETKIDREIDFGEDRSLRLVGRFDRRFDRPDGRLIGDYKTGKVAKADDETPMLKGLKLQVPLYRLMSDGPTRVEVLGIGPTHDPETADQEERIRHFDGFEAKYVEGFKETVRVLADLMEAGKFPFHKSGACDWCAYTLACRQQHPPTIEREERAADTLDYLDVLRKTKRDGPTLARVRGET